MKLDDIEAFISVVQRQSLSQAAQSMALTQSAITRRIQNFEEDLGIPVLDRHSKPPRPTQLGLRIYDQCLNIAREMQKLRSLVTGTPALAGTLRIGMTQAISDLSLHEILRQQKTSWPELEVRITTGWANFVVEQIENGAVDAGIVLMPSSRKLAAHLKVTPLAHCEMVVIAAKGFGDRQSHRLASLAKHGWILNPDGCGFRAELAQSLADQGLKLELNLDTFACETQMEMVAGGYGLGLVPRPLLDRSIYRERLDIIPVGDFTPAADLWLISRPELGELATPVQAFAEISAAIFRSASTR